MVQNPGELRPLSEQSKGSREQDGANREELEERIFWSCLHRTHEIWSVSKLIILGTKESLTITWRMARQSGAFSPNKRQIDSTAILIIGGGFFIDLISWMSFFRIDCTAGKKGDERVISRRLGWQLTRCYRCRKWRSSWWSSRPLSPNVGCAIQHPFLQASCRSTRWPFEPRLEDSAVHGSPPAAGA